MNDDTPLTDAAIGRTMKPKRLTKRQSGGKPVHPAHLAREVRTIPSGEFTCWTIYPDQIEPMIDKMAEALERHDWDSVSYLDLARAALVAIGVEKVVTSRYAVRKIKL